MDMGLHDTAAACLLHVTQRGSLNELKILEFSPWIVAFHSDGLLFILSYLKTVFNYIIVKVVISQWGSKYVLYLLSAK